MKKMLIISTIQKPNVCRQFLIYGFVTKYGREKAHSPYNVNVNDNRGRVDARPREVPGGGLGGYLRRTPWWISLRVTSGVIVF